MKDLRTLSKVLQTLLKCLSTIKSNLQLDYLHALILVSFSWIPKPSRRSYSQLLKLSTIKLRNLYQMWLRNALMRVKCGCMNLSLFLEILLTMLRSSLFNKAIWQTSTTDSNLLETRSTCSVSSTLSLLNTLSISQRKKTKPIIWKLSPKSQLWTNLFQTCNKLKSHSLKRSRNHLMRRFQNLIRLLTIWLTLQLMKDTLMLKIFRLKSYQPSLLN